MTTAEKSPAALELPAFAWRGVLAVAAVAAALLTAASGRYGYFGDELYFIAAGRHLDWSYADQPPLVPLLALLMDTLAPDSVMALRIPATLLTVLAIVLAALLAREFGGAWRAQVLAAAAVAASPTFLVGGHLLATSTIDPVLWTLVILLVVRWVRTRDDRLLLAVGVATAVALQAKLLIGAFWLVALLALLVVGPRDMLRRPLLWAGAAIALVSTVPTLLWQSAHGWPLVDFSRQVAAESVYAGGMVGFLPFAVIGAGLLGGTVLAGYGLVRLFRSPELAPYRFLAWTALGVTAIFLLTGGRPYYVNGLFPLLWAVGAAELGRRTVAIWWRWVPSLPTFAVSLVVLVAAGTLPFAPIESHAGKPLMIGNFQLDEFGWPELADDVAAAYRELPPPTAADAVLLTSSYWTASALDHFGPGLGLPEVYAPHRGYAFFGVPPEDATAAVLVTSDPDAFRGMFADLRQVGAVDNDHDINNLVQGTPIWVAEGRLVPWEQIWADVRRL